MLTKKLAYTDGSYQRLNKKLDLQLSKGEAESLIQCVLNEADEVIEKGKNHYVSDHKRQIRLTINTSSGTLITADKIDPE